MQNLFNNISEIPPEYRKVEEKGVVPPKTMIFEGREYTYVGSYERQASLFGRIASIFGSKGEENITKPVYVLSKSLSIQTPSTEQTPKTSSAKQTQRVGPQVMDVPDDGNCLFYALGVGLRKKYAEYPKIQEKLNWNTQVEQLKGDLSKEHKLLETPGKQLREQAAGYLENHASNDEIMLALIEGIGSHLEVARKKIEEEESLVPILMMDIEELENQRQTQSVKEQLEAKRAHLGVIQDSIDFQRANLPSEEDLQGYIEMTKKDHVYCGVAQLFALSKEYNIPIRVLYNYGKANQYEQTLNEEAKNHDALPTLTVAHVNGNHFKFVND